MATTVSSTTLRDLAGFRAQKGCVISFFLDLDPSVTPTAADLATRVNSLLSSVEPSDAGELGHDQRQTLKADVERIRRYVDDDFDRDGSWGLAIFAGGLDDLWVTLPLAERVPDAIKISNRAYLAPLVPLLGRGDGALVAVVNRERGDVYRLRAGRLHEVADHTEDAPRRHDQGGWSQARYQRHIDNLAADHMRTVADEIDRQVRRLNGIRVVIVCNEEYRPEFAELLSQESQAALAGWTHVEAHATPADVLEAVTPVLEDWRARREVESLERWREEAGRDGRATKGWADTLDAASDARVELLLFQEGVDHEAWQCPSCGRVAAREGSCPLDGTQMERSPDGLDLVVHQTLQHGGAVWAVRHHQDLEPVEGIGALLRF